MLRESLLLSTIAGGLGLLLATWLVPVLARAMDLSDGLDYSPDWRVLLFMTGLVAIVGTAAGLAPARYGSRGEVLHVLQRGATDRVTRSRLRLPFVGFQAAVSMLLVIVAALLARSALRLSSLSPGFDANRVLAVSLDLPRADFDRQAYFGQAVTVLRALPSIEQISLSQILPFGGLRHSVWLKQRGASWQLNLVHTDDAFFSTTGAHIVQGRGFTSAEIAEEAPIAVVSESIADAFFPAGAAVGRPLSTIPARAGAMAPATIIGVVTDAFLLGFDAERSGTIYRPLIHGDVNPPGLLIRTARPDTVTPEIERTLHRLNPRTRVRTWTVADQMQSYLGAFDRRAWLTAPTAILALVLALLGIYGVTAFAANQRMEEVSVRFAVGATATDIVWLLMKDGLRPVLMGLPIGLGAGFALAQVFARELSAISPYDPISFGAAFWLLTTFAIVAILIPALRMSRVAPATLLRQS
jgi:predicted permease